MAIALYKGLITWVGNEKVERAGFNECAEITFIPILFEACRPGEARVSWNKLRCRQTEPTRLMQSVIIKFYFNIFKYMFLVLKEIWIVLVSCSVHAIIFCLLSQIFSPELEVSHIPFSVIWRRDWSSQLYKQLKQL